MKTSIALLIKFVATFIAACISFSLFDNIFLSIVLIIAASGTVLNYFIGDLFILPRFDNIIASIMDGVLAAVTAYIILLVANYGQRSSIFIFAIMVAAFEVFFHMYLLKTNIIKKKTTNTGPSSKQKLNYNTEIAKEMNPDGNTWKSVNVNNKK